MKIKNSLIESRAYVNEIPYLDFNKTYVGESYYLNKPIYEHTRDSKQNNKTIAFGQTI